MYMHAHVCTHMPRQLSGVSFLLPPWVLGIKLRPSCFLGKHFTLLSYLASLILLRFDWKKCYSRVLSDLCSGISFFFQYLGLTLLWAGSLCFIMCLLRLRISSIPIHVEDMGIIWCTAFHPFFAYSWHISLNSWSDHCLAVHFWGPFCNFWSSLCKSVLHCCAYSSHFVVYASVRVLNWSPLLSWNLQTVNWSNFSFVIRIGKF